MWPDGIVPQHAAAYARTAGRYHRALSAVVVAAFLLIGIGGVTAWRSVSAEPPATDPASTGPGGPSSAGEPRPTSADRTTRPTATTVARPATAPDLVGRPLAEARAALPASIQVTTAESVDETLTGGTVTAQDPKAGDPLGDTIRLTVTRQPVRHHPGAIRPVNGR